MDSLEPVEVLTVEEAQQIAENAAAIAVDGVTDAETVTNEQMQEITEGQTEQIAEVVQQTSEVNAQTVTENVLGALQEREAQLQTVTIDETQYNELIENMHNLATINFTLALCVCLLVGCEIFAQFRSRWG